MAPPVRDALSTVERFFQFSVLGMLASGFLALADSGHLDWVTQIALVAALLARAAKVSGWLMFDLSNRTIAVWTLAAVCFYPLDGWFLSGSAPAATLHLAVILTALKLLTTKTDRDYLYLKMIALMELVGRRDAGREPGVLYLPGAVPAVRRGGAGQRRGPPVRQPAWRPSRARGSGRLAGGSGSPPSCCAAAF